MDIVAKQEIKSWVLHISVALFLFTWPWVFFKYVPAGKSIVYQYIEPESKWGEYAIQLKLMKPRSEWKRHHAVENRVIAPKGKLSEGEVWIQGKKYKKSTDNIYIINGQKIFFVDGGSNEN